MNELDSLRADCAHCAAWCCTALAFRTSEEFAFDKPSGVPCRNLQADFRCGIHAALRQNGMQGCTNFDCFGAGQKVTQLTFGGQSWRDDPARAPEMFRVFRAMLDLHEILWYLAVARQAPKASALWPEIDDAAESIEAFTQNSSEALQSVDTLSLYSEVTPLLDAVSELVRADGAHAGEDLSGRDFTGADLRGTRLAGARLRGAVLTAADLRGVNLGCADLLGADLRNARLDNADLSQTLFATQSQLNSAHGDPRTRLPQSLARPGHWAHRRRSQ